MDLNKAQFLDYLIEKKAEYEESGFIPTLDTLIVELREEELAEDAKRLVAEEKI